MAFTRLAQWGAGVGVLVYGVLFYDWEGRREGEEGAFAGVREWWARSLGEIGGRRGRDLKQKEGDRGVR